MGSGTSFKHVNTWAINYLHLHANIYIILAFFFNAIEFSFKLLI